VFESNRDRMIETRAPSAKFPCPAGWNNALQEDAIQTLPEGWGMHYVHEWDGTHWLKIECLK